MRLCVLVARITIQTGRIESVCIIFRMDVVARVDRRFDSSTILRLSTLFHAVVSANYELLFGMPCRKDNNNVRKLNFCLLFANYYLHYQKVNERNLD